MSGFTCPRNSDVDCDDLQAQLDGDTNVYIMMFPHKCCCCGLRCCEYIKLYKTGGRWKLAKNDDNPKDPCVIGSCCFDKKTLTFKFGNSDNIK